jgi:hypothetical protein
VRARRRSRGLERAGGLPAGELGLPLPAARELVLAHAWREIAGEAVARRVQPLRVQRGVLELAVADGAWERAIEELLPRLAGLLAARRPDLRLSRLRLHVPGAPARTARIEPVPDDPPRERARPARPEPAASPPPPEPLEARLRRAIARYLEVSRP